MSAFLVSDAHINALLTFANKNMGTRSFQRCGRDVTSGTPSHPALRYGDVADLTAMGKLLLAENYRSLAARYGVYTPPEIDYVFEFGKALTPIAAIRACDCFDYQASENGDYFCTDAARLIMYIRKLAMDLLITQTNRGEAKPDSAGANTWHIT